MMPASFVEDDISHLVSAERKAVTEFPGEARPSVFAPIKEPSFKTDRELPPVTFGDYLTDPLIADAPLLDDEPIDEQIDIAPIDDTRWQAMVEQITMSVLQRIDIFSESAMQEKLA